jgi:hypothetical protein
MSHFILHNKMSGRRNFEFPADFPFDRFPDSGILAVPATLDERIGVESTLILFDKTPFIYRLARVRPFDLRMKMGMAPTNHGPVAYLLFYIPDPSRPSEPFFMVDHHIDPFNEQMVSPWRDLALQSHWHLFLLDGKCEQINLFEFENVFGLDEVLDQIADAIGGEAAGNFGLAKEEFSATYTLEDLWSMS